MAALQALAFLSLIVLVTVGVESSLLKILATHCLVEGGQASLLNSHKTQMPTHLCVHSTSLLQSTMKIFKLLFLKPLKDSFYCSVTHFTVDKKKEIFGGIRLDGFIEARRRGEIMIKVETKLFF